MLHVFRTVNTQPAVVNEAKRVYDGKLRISGLIERIKGRIIDQS